MPNHSFRIKPRNEHIAYAPVAMVLATLPHSRVDGCEFVRRNGHHWLSLIAPSHTGIPYGVFPRLLLIWMTTQVKIKNSRDITLGDSCRQFMRSLGTQSTGGKSGSIGRLRRQMLSLLQCSISFYCQEDFQDIERGMRLTDHSFLWWKPSDDLTLKGGFLRISEQFFLEINRSAFPIDMRAVKELRRSPMALDIYMWITYRVYGLGKPCLIPWEQLSQQFGSDYSKLWHFEKAFTKYLERVKTVYPDLKAYGVSGRGLYLYPSRPHISPVCG